MKRLLLHLGAVGAFASSLVSPAAEQRDKWKAELARAEAGFCAQVESIGVSEAFAANMAELCFMPGQLTLSRSEYETRFKKARSQVAPPPRSRLVWKPIMVDVSDDGTLGYTWGSYEYTPPATAERPAAETHTGIYLTIWKRQPDGTWKFVYDGSPEVGPPERLTEFLQRPDLPKPPATKR